MNYQEAVQYLFNVAPLFQNIGQGAYKEGLSNTHALDQHFGHPHQHFKTIHVAGTNGKGSCSHTIAAILQAEGYRVGLYTSPHLVDFRERIRVNGVMIPEQRVVDFVEQERAFFEPLYPSFFELTTALAFKYFEEENVDFAVIEVGLGGRLDCTNIISPLLSVITNISFDHMQFLGDTLEQIAHEKAGIIKQGIPVVIGETNGHAEVKNVFAHTAEALQAPILFADEQAEITDTRFLANGQVSYHSRSFGQIESQLSGLCQEKNAATIICAINTLRNIGLPISDTSVFNGFSHVCELTGLQGRWQRIQDHPLVICDTGHNPGGLAYIGKQLGTIPHRQLRMVIGMVGDKDVQSSLRLLPQKATYYFTQASVKRAMSSEDIKELGQTIGLQGHSFQNVAEAYRCALNEADDEDLIFVGGSSFVVADLLASFSN